MNEWSHGPIYSAWGSPSAWWPSTWSKCHSRWGSLPYESTLIGCFLPKLFAPWFYWLLFLNIFCRWSAVLFCILLHYNGSVKLDKFFLLLKIFRDFPIQRFVLHLRKKEGAIKFCGFSQKSRDYWIKWDSLI